MVKKFIAISLILMLALSGAAALAADELAGHWAESTLKAYKDAKYLDAYADGSIKPNQAITRGEFVVLMNRVFGYSEKASSGFTDVSSSSPFYADVLIAKQAGYINGYPADNTFRPEKAITREEVAAVITKAMKISQTQTTAAAAFKDSAQISEWAQNYMNAIIAKGYFGGYGDGTVKPKNNITRAESVVMVDRIAGTILKKEGISDKVVSGNLTVSGKDLTLKNVTVKGDLILAAGIGEANVTLDGVKVAGTTFVQGGGENSVIFNNTTLNDLIIYKSNGKVRIVAKGSTSIESSSVNSGAKLQDEGLTGTGFEKVEVLEVKAGEALILDGNFVSIDMQAPMDINVTESSKIGNLQISEKAEGSKVDISEKASITTLDIKGASDIQGKGKVTTLQLDVKANASNRAMNVDVAVSKLEVKSSVAEVAIGKNAVIQEMTIQKTATNTNMTVAAGSTVKNLIAESVVAVKGTGTIDNATIKVQGVTIEKAPTNITIEGNVTLQAGGQVVSSTVINDTSKLPTTGGTTGGGTTGGTTGGSTDDNDTPTTPTTTVVTAVTITGTTSVGSTLTATPTPSNATASYQWQRADSAGGTYTNITGATAATYVLTASDLNKYIKVVITGTGSFSSTATSAATAQITELQAVLVKKAQYGLPTAELKVQISGNYVNTYELYFDSNLLATSTNDGRVTIAEALLNVPSRITIKYSGETRTVTISNTTWQ